jgi:hypothetical protein
MNNTIIQDTAVVGLFDILGFRSRIRSAEPSQFVQLLNCLSTMPNESLVGEEYVGSMQYSDSIVLYGRSGDIDLDIAMVVISASNLLGRASRMGFPIRGALSLGPMYIDQENRQILGVPLVDAYDIEQQQDWMGAVVDLRHEERFSSAFVRSPIPECLVRYPAPLKEGTRRDLLCIGWTFRTDRHTVEDSFSNAEESHEVYRKLKNTLDFFDACIATWEAWQK